MKSYAMPYPPRTTNLPPPGFQANPNRGAGFQLRWNAVPPICTPPRGPVPRTPMGVVLLGSRFESRLFSSDTPPDDSRRKPRFRVSDLVTRKSDLRTSAENSDGCSVIGIEIREQIVQLRYSAG